MTKIVVYTTRKLQLFLLDQKRPPSLWIFFLDIHPSNSSSLQGKCPLKDLGTEHIVQFQLGWEVALVSAERFKVLQMKARENQTKPSHAHFHW